MQENSLILPSFEAWPYPLKFFLCSFPYFLFQIHGSLCFYCFTAHPQTFQKAKDFRALLQIFSPLFVFSNLITCWPSHMEKKESSILKIFIIFITDNQREISSSSGIRRTKAFYQKTLERKLSSDLSTTILERAVIAGSPLSTDLPL